MTDPTPSLHSPRWKGFRSDFGNASSTRILVIDDNEPLRYSVMRALKEAGYQVLEAGTGADGLRLSADGPDLILLDVNLPDMSGFQVCRQIKTTPATANIPVLHISSTFVESEYRVKGLEGGADAYLAEPIDRAELVATVNALLRLKHAENMARQQAERAEAALAQIEELNKMLELRITERTAELVSANESLRELSSRLFQTQDDERRRIARDLHDSVGQALAAIKMNHAMVLRDSTDLKPRSQDALAECDSLIEEILKSIRTISHLLHPPLLDEAGLAVALNNYLEEFSSRSGIDVLFDCPVPLERLSPEVETNIFRIFQECLGNVHRHSNSLTAKVTLRADQDRILLEVSDQGVGIPPARLKELRRGIRTGVGLRGMQERLAPLGGELTLHSEGQGTTVRVAVPLNRKSQQQAAN